MLGNCPAIPKVKPKKMLKYYNIYYEKYYYTVSYAIINLPERVYPETTGSDTIKIIYDATGVKWQKIAKANSVTEIFKN